MHAGPAAVWGKNLHPPGTQAGAAIGLVLLRADPTLKLFATLSTWPMPSESGETFLARRDGERQLVDGPLGLGAADLALVVPGLDGGRQGDDRGAGETGRL